MSCTPSGQAGGGRDPKELAWPGDAPMSAGVEGSTYSLEVDAWRSFQPVGGGSGDPMIAVLRLTGSAPLAASTTIEAVQFRRGPETWSSAAREESPREVGAPRVEFIVRDGPRWPTGDTVIVIARVLVAGQTRLDLGTRIVIARVD